MSFLYVLGNCDGNGDLGDCNDNGDLGDCEGDLDDGNCTDRGSGCCDRVQVVVIPFVGTS